MIQSLRTVHRRSFVSLAVLLPAILVVGLASRHRSTVAQAANGASGYISEKIGARWEKNAIATELYSESANSEQTYVVLNPGIELLEPDLLLYWTDSDNSVQALSPNARLLGPFNPGEKYLLRSNEARSGRLVLYSLANGAVVDQARIEKQP